MTNETSVTHINFNSLDYFLNIKSIVLPNQVMSFILLRQEMNQERSNDILLGKITASLKHVDTTYGICRKLEYLNDSRALVGCGALIGSVICATAIPEIGVTPMAYVCEAMWEYSIATGVVDCITGSLEAIAKTIGSLKEFKDLELKTNVLAEKRTDIFLNLLDRMCADIKQSNNIESTNLNTETHETRSTVQPLTNDNKGENNFGSNSSDKAIDKFVKDKADKERADKERADKERADKERADKEKADKEKADKEKADKLAAEKAAAAKEKASQEGNKGNKDKNTDTGRDLAGFFDGPNN